jgi:hypothetical protein
MAQHSKDRTETGAMMVKNGFEYSTYSSTDYYTLVEI